MTRHKYTHYNIQVEGIKGINGCIADAMSLPGETLSQAVQKFLRDILKSDTIVVKIEAHNTEVTEI